MVSPNAGFRAIPWDESAVVVRREASDAFNQGSFRAAATLFHALEARVSGGQKPLYRALGELALGYGLWEQFHYRQAWDKLKTSVKALDMASIWAGPGVERAVAPDQGQQRIFREAGARSCGSQGRCRARPLGPCSSPRARGS